MAFRERIWADPDLKWTGKRGFTAGRGELRRGVVIGLWAWLRNTSVLEV